MRKGSQGGLSGFGLSSWKDGVAINWNRKATGGECLGGKMIFLVSILLSLRCVLVFQAAGSGQQSTIGV